MAENNSANQKYKNNADGWELAGGTSARKLTVTGADITMTGSGSATMTFPSASATLVGRDTTDTLTNKTLTAPIISAHSASAGSALKFTSGTLMTTAEDGAIEMDGDCFYGTTDGGNRGYIPVRHFIRADSTRTLPNDTAENAIFNSPASGTLTLETGLYMFEGLIAVTSMSATSGNALIDIRGAGTATIGSWLWDSWGRDSTSGSAGTISGGWNVAENSAASIVTAATGTAMSVRVSGTFEVTSAGTIIPSIDQVTAAAAVISVGSYMMFERIGSTSTVSVGQWS